MAEPAAQALTGDALAKWYADRGLACDTTALPSAEAHQQQQAREALIAAAQSPPPGDGDG